MINTKFFCLQIFANTTESEKLSAEMKTYYEKRLLDHSEPKLVHDQFADKYPIPKNGGKSIEFRKYSALPKATMPLQEGVTPAGQDLEMSTITATISQYGGWVPVTDILQWTAIDNNLVQATKVLGSQAGRTLDTVTREVMNGGTNTIYAPKVAADGTETAVLERDQMDGTSKINMDLIFRAARLLKTMNADLVDDSFVAIIHPSVSYDLMRSEEWRETQKYSHAEHIYAGEIGKIGNVRFVESTEAKIWKDATCPGDGNGGKLAVYSTIVLGAHAYATTEVTGGGLQHIVKPLGSGEDQLNQRASAGWKATKAAVRLAEEFMVRIECCSTYSNMDDAN